MSVDPALPTARLIYDPLATFVTVFADDELAADLAEALTCSEVNVLAGLLTWCNRADAAATWLTAHRTYCDRPTRH